jgi:hypothetical protein
MRGLYQQYETDAKVEKEGVWLEFGPNTHDNEIKIRVARAGGANESYLKQLEFRSKPIRRGIQTETVDRKKLETIVREVYAETVVVAWENVEDREGKLLEFNKENVLKVLTDLPWIYQEIMEASTKLQLFRKEILEEDAKN